jgi:hypothetical protein
MMIDWEERRRPQHYMALERWKASDSRLREVGQEYESRGTSSLAEKILSIANESGRLLAKGAREVLADLRKQVLR